MNCASNQYRVIKEFVFDTKSNDCQINYDSHRNRSYSLIFNSQDFELNSDLHQ